MLSGLLWLCRNGTPWRALPDRFGKWQTVYCRFRQWVRGGLWAFILKRLRKRHGAFFMLMMDSTVVRAHQHAAGAKGSRDQALGRSRGGLTTKIHLLADATGRPIDFILTGGHVNDCTQAQALLRLYDGPRPLAVLADKGYDSDAIIEDVMQQVRATAVIPSKANRSTPRPFSKRIYRCRHAIENTFAHLKQFRRVATRYDKRADSYQAFVTLACIARWIKR